MEQPVARWEMLHRRLGADDRCSSLAGDSYVKYCDLGDSITTVLSRGGVLDLWHPYAMRILNLLQRGFAPTAHDRSVGLGVWSPGVCLEYFAIRCGSGKRHVSFLRTARTVGTTWTWPVRRAGGRSFMCLRGRYAGKAVVTPSVRCSLVPDSDTYM